ncbi:TetR/AcrR family transcriptional regulator [uncultured Nocardioides sp.]|uniref:TetR/AcrR family transcriptional regulator n=1 Tax=uncultured Nocardioides sp. TaxID=198441 RepID=UPI00261B36CA|nr:TetR/AcrR family transcriptional regulator [uncultured Nocardioides sp.]
MPVARAAKRLRPAVPALPGSTRRAQYSAATRRTLVDVATELFTEQGYAATSLDSIVAGAEVTKGALYHHFGGKQALFEDVFATVERDAGDRIRASLADAGGPWDQALVGLRAFLDVVREPAYRRVVVQEGPAVLGHERFREQERTCQAIVVDLVAAVLADADGVVDQPMLETISDIFFGAMSTAGETVTASDDPDAASARVEAAVAYLVTGLRTMVEAGVPLPSSGAPTTAVTSRS